MSNAGIATVGRIQAYKIVLRNHSENDMERFCFQM